MFKHLKPKTSLRKCYWLSDDKLVTPVSVFTDASFTRKVIHPTQGYICYAALITKFIAIFNFWVGIESS